MVVTLTKNEIDLILYCLEQQAYEFNADEELDFDSIVQKLNPRIANPPAPPW
jgi:hypothetical protein